jgi:hypothetical protein
MALVNLRFDQRKWSLEVLLEHGGCGVSTKITRPNTIRLFPAWCSKECCLHLNTTHTARPEAWSWPRMCRVPSATIQNVCQSVVRRRQQLCTFWTFVTLCVTISQLCLCLYVNCEHSKCEALCLWDFLYVWILSSGLIMTTRRQTDPSGHAFWRVDFDLLYV